MFLNEYRWKSAFDCCVYGALAHCQLRPSPWLLRQREATAAGLRHSVGGGEYGTVRAGAFMGLRILSHAAQQQETTANHSEPSPCSVTCDPAAIGVPRCGPAAYVHPVAGTYAHRDALGAGGGYLANISPSEYQEHQEDQLPASMSGRDFLQQYGSHWDTATTIDPALRFTA